MKISSTLSNNAVCKFYDSKKESEGNTSMNTVSILVVEDDEGLQNLLRRLLSQAGYEATIVGSGLEAIRVAKEMPVHVLMTDLKLPDIDGLAVLERIHQIDSKVIGIVMTGYGSIDCAVKAMKAGAFDFLTKPFDNEVFTITLNRALEAHRRRQSTLSSRKSVRDRYQMEQCVGSSEPIRQVLEFVGKVADHGSTVLIQGRVGPARSWSRGCCILTARVKIVRSSRSTVGPFLRTYSNLSCLDTRRERLPAQSKRESGVLNRRTVERSFSTKSAS